MSRPARYPIATPAISGTYDGWLDVNPDRLRTLEEAFRFRTSSEVASPYAYAPSSLSPTDSAVNVATLAWGPAECASCWMFVGVVELALLASGISVAGLWPTDSSAIFCGSVLLLSIDVLRCAPHGGPLKEPGRIAPPSSETETRERRSDCSQPAARQRFVRIEIGFVPGSRRRSPSD